MYIRSVLMLRGGADQASLALWVETLGGVAQEGRKFPHLQQRLEGRVKLQQMPLSEVLQRKFAWRTSAPFFTEEGGAHGRVKSKCSDDDNDDDDVLVARQGGDH